jgi:3-oxoacyl-[acyl-carrier protein] reductase
MSEFQDKVVLITGAGRGIGRSIAQTFARQGAIIAANDLTPINLDQTVADIVDEGGRARDYVFDIAKKMPVQALIQAVLADWGRLDILINNAGVDPHFSLLDIDEWDWRRTMDVNLMGPFFLIQSVGRVMRESGGGCMVNLAAAAGRAHGWSGHGAFVVSKQGLIGLTRQAALELAPYNIRVNAVCPGVFDTGRQSYPGQDKDRSSANEIPLGRSGQPQEIAKVVLFLCSSDSSYLTGQAINLDGGLVMC